MTAFNNHRANMNLNLGDAHCLPRFMNVCPIFTGLPSRILWSGSYNMLSSHWIRFGWFHFWIQCLLFGSWIVFCGKWFVFGPDNVDSSHILGKPIKNLLTGLIIRVSLSALPVSGNMLTIWHHNSIGIYHNCLSQQNLPFFIWNWSKMVPNHLQHSSFDIKN